MKTISFEIIKTNISGIQNLSLPVDAEILHLSNNTHNIFIHYISTDTSDKQLRQFTVLNEKSILNEKTSVTHIGTVVNQKEFLYFVFEINHA